MFYYLIHWYLLHTIMFLVLFGQGFGVDDFRFGFSFGRPEGQSGLGLPGVYAIWLTAVFTLYPLCKWYGKYKSNHREKPWLQYLQVGKNTATQGSQEPDFFPATFIAILLCKLKTMSSQEQVNYERIAQAIEFIRANFRNQPSLENVASAVHMSPFHFQRLFSEWAGTTPKKFLQYTSLEYAKSLLKEKQATLFDTAFETGLSGTSRLHDLFISIEGMTPAEFKQGGRDLLINYSFAESPFGPLIIASTAKGICHMAFIDSEDEGLDTLVEKFPSATLHRKLDMLQQNALFIFRKDWTGLPEIKLHLRGTAFQLKVWDALLKIPAGKLTTYGSIGKEINMPTASRAIGTAIGANPVAYLIPCHRVIQGTGEIGGYHWGPVRKKAMIGWEAAITQG